MEILREVQKYAWLVGTVIAITVFALTQWLTARRSSKAFSYDILTNTLLVSKKGEAKDRVKILFDDRPIENVCLIEILLKNTGVQPISDKDFYKPVSVNFSQITEILEADVVSKQPADFEPKIEILGNTVNLAPTLMNSGDNLTIKVLVAAANPQVSVTGRISGVKEINVIKPETLFKIPIMVWACLLVGCTLFGVTVAPNNVYGWTATIVVVISMLAVTQFDDKRRKRP